MRSRIQASRLSVIVRKPDAGPSIAFDLPRGNAIEIRLRSKISRAELKKVKDAFDLLAQLAFVEEDNETDSTKDQISP